MQHWQRNETTATTIGHLRSRDDSDLHFTYVTQNSYILYETVMGRTTVGSQELLRYEGYSDQWEVNDFTLVAFVESSSWCWVGEPENGTSLLWQHLNILQGKKRRDQSITTNSRNDDWYNVKFSVSLIQGRTAVWPTNLAILVMMMLKY
jgi:hypothetical protein